MVLLSEAIAFFFARAAEVEPTGATIPSSGTSFTVVVVAIVAALMSCFGQKVIFTEAYRGWSRYGRVTCSLPAAVCANQLFGKCDSKVEQYHLAGVRAGLIQDVRICNGQVKYKPEHILVFPTFALYAIVPTKLMFLLTPPIKLL